MWERLARDGNGPEHIRANTEFDGDRAPVTMVDYTTLDGLADRTKQPVFESAPRTVRVSLDPGEEIAEHSHPGTDIVFFVVEGALDLSLDGRTYETTGGDLLRFEGERTIAGEASEPTTAVVVLAQRQPSPRS